MKHLILRSLLLLALTSFIHAESHQFVDKDGKIIKGEIVSGTSTMVTIKLAATGQNYSYARSGFGKDSQDYISGWLKANPQGATGKSGAAKTLGAYTPWRLDAKVLPRKSSRHDKSGDFDDKMQTLTMVTTVKNSDTKFLDGAQATLMVFGKNLETGNVAVLARNEFTLTLKPGETTSQEGSQISLKFDDSAYAKFGSKYEGYLLYITDKENHVVTQQGSNNVYVKNIANCAALKTNDECDKDMKVIRARQE